jgi:hypothetical protein
MKFNSKLIIEKTNVTETLLYQLKKDIISDKLTGDMLRDLNKTIINIIHTDF